MADTTINGTLLLVYMDGVKVAAQKGVTITLNVDTYPASTKDSGRWACHGKGERSFEVALDGLISTTGKTAKALYDYIINGSAILLVIKGTTNTYFAAASMTNVSLVGPQDEASSLSGTISATGQVYTMLTNLLTDPDLDDDATYDTFTHTASPPAVTSAIDAGGGAVADSNIIAVTDTHVYKLVTFLTLTGALELPTVGIYDTSAVAYISNQPSLAAGLNFISLTATATEAVDAFLRIENTAACNFALTTIYIWDTTP